MERERFLERTGTREDGAGISPRGAASPTSARAEAPGLALDCAVSTIRAIVRSPARGGLWPVCHVWLRGYHFGFMDRRLYGNQGREEKQVLGARYQVTGSCTCNAEVAAGG